MKEENKIQSTMFLDLEQKTMFDQAQRYAYEYLDTVMSRNVFPQKSGLENLKYFVESMPQQTTSALDVVTMLHQHGAPATVAQLGGRYFGFVCGSAVPAGLAAKTMATFWDQNSAMHVLSPVTAKLETICENWLRELFGLPEKTVAGFVSGTSAANFCGLAAARYRLLKNLNWNIDDEGLFDAPKIRVVLGRQAHSTVIKALALLGFGKNMLEWADVDDQGRIIPEALPALDERTIVIVQAGNVNSGSFDDFKIICNKAKQAGAWVHVDGAFGLWAAAVDKLKHLTHGIENANSWAVDGHKTLNTPYDCGVIMCNDKEAIISALHNSGSYIILSETERDGMFYTPEMSRRARGIELWATLKYLGRDGINEMILNMHERAIQFADLLRKVNGFEVLNDVVFNQVLVQCKTDAITENVMRKIQELRDCWVGGSSWHGRKVIRISICSWATTSNDINISARSFERALSLVLNEPVVNSN